MGRFPGGRRTHRRQAAWNEEDGRLYTYRRLAEVVDSLKAVTLACGAAYWDLSLIPTMAWQHRGVLLVFLFGMLVHWLPLPVMAVAVVAIGFRP